MGGGEGRGGVGKGRGGEGRGGKRGGEGRGQEAFLIMWPRRLSALNPPDLGGRRTPSYTKFDVQRPSHSQDMGDFRSRRKSAW